MRQSSLVIGLIALFAIATPAEATHRWFYHPGYMQPYPQTYYQPQSFLSSLGINPIQFASNALGNLGLSGLSNFLHILVTPPGGDGTAGGGTRPVDPPVSAAVRANLTAIDQNLSRALDKTNGLCKDLKLDPVKTRSGGSITAPREPAID
jgi:hypothetical protein